jgi:hypothetical protein
MARWTAPGSWTGAAADFAGERHPTPKRQGAREALWGKAHEDAEPAKTCYARQASGAALFARRCASPPQSILTAVTERS